MDGTAGCIADRLPPEVLYIVFDHLSIRDLWSRVRPLNQTDLAVVVEYLLARPKRRLDSASLDGCEVLEKYEIPYHLRSEVWFPENLQPIRRPLLRHLQSIHVRACWKEYLERHYVWHEGIPVQFVELEARLRFAQANFEPLIADVLNALNGV